MSVNTDTPKPDQAARSADEAEFAQQALTAEAKAIERITITADFHRSVDLIAERITNLLDTSPESASPESANPTPSGSLVVSGIGKSGLIGQKLSATFASTGTPSSFMHAAEATHGDLGRIRKSDVVLLLSYSGNTEEVVTLAELVRQDNVPIIAIVGPPENDLARCATATLSIGDVTEACPHNLAPTASTTAMLAIGDALALTVSRRRKFEADDFRKLHPGGGLGRQLMPVTEAMRFKVGTNLPTVSQQTTVQDAYAQADQHAKDAGLRRPGALLITDQQSEQLLGIITDGDLRSALIAQGPAAWTGSVADIMTRNPTTLPQDATVRDALHIVREKRFDEIPVINPEGIPLGLIDVQDLAALKVIEG